jgi:hypothetical protein
MPRDDWARAKRREIGEREARRQEQEAYLGRKRALAKRLKKQAKGAVIHSKKDSVASKPKGPQGSQSKGVIQYPPSRKGTIMEPMICMDCETVYTTDDPHIRDRGRVLCVKCKGMLTLLHQYDSMRDESELEQGLRAVLGRV